jgi:hypothetical protein
VTIGSAQAPFARSPKTPLFTDRPGSAACTATFLRVGPHYSAFPSGLDHGAVSAGSPPGPHASQCRAAPLLAAQELDEPAESCPGRDRPDLVRPPPGPIRARETIRVGPPSPRGEPRRRLPSSPALIPPLYPASEYKIRIPGSYRSIGMTFALI